MDIAKRSLDDNRTSQQIIDAIKEALSCRDGETPVAPGRFPTGEDTTTFPARDSIEWKKQGIKRYNFRLFDWVLVYNEAVCAKYGDDTEEAKKHLSNAKGVAASAKKRLEQNQAVRAKCGDDTEEVKKHLNNAKAVAASVNNRLEQNQAVCAKYRDDTEEAKKHLSNAKAMAASVKKRLEQNQAVCAKYGDDTEEVKKHLNNAKATKAARKANLE